MNHRDLNKVTFTISDYYNSVLFNVFNTKKHAIKTFGDYHSVLCVETCVVQLLIVSCITSLSNPPSTLHH